MSLTRKVDENLYQAKHKFENVSDLVGRALDPTKPTLTKSLAKNRDKMNATFE